MEVAELVNAAGGLGRGEKVAWWVSPAGLQALHAPLGAAPVRALPQICVVIAGEVTGGGAAGCLLPPSTSLPVKGGEVESLIEAVVLFATIIHCAELHHIAVFNSKV